MTVGGDSLGSNACLMNERDAADSARSAKYFDPKKRQWMIERLKTLTMSAFVLGALAMNGAGCAANTDVDTEQASAKLVASGIGSNQGIMWGMNGHIGAPDVSIYRKVPLETQMGTLAALGLKHYRVPFSQADADRVDYLRRVLAAAQPHGILVTPILESSEYGTLHETYWTAHDMAFNYAQTFRGAIPVYEIGNEENHVVHYPFQDNSDPKFFQSGAMYQQVLAKMRGLVDGVRQGDPGAKIAVGDAGGCNYGFTQALWNDNVRWDVTIMHAYDFFGDIDAGHGCAAGNDLVGHHTQYGKPIWITEFNYTPAVASQSKRDMGVGMTNMMAKFASLAAKYDIEVVDVYELYDEADLQNVDEPERHFGVYTANAGTTEASSALHAFVASHPSKSYQR